MRRLSETLTDLIGFAEETITKPQKHLGFTIGDHFNVVSQEIRRAAALPAEGIRTTSAGIVMITVLDEFFASDREPTSRFLMLAGATLPWLRAEAWRAKLNEQEARASS